MLPLNSTPSRPRSHGFHVVCRVADVRFVGCRRWHDVLGYQMSEVWIFGEPITADEHELSRQIEQYIRVLAVEAVHRFTLPA